MTMAGAADHPAQPLAHAIRFLSVDAIVRATEGHQGVPLGMAEIATALYTEHLKYDAADASWWDRDRVVLSNGHGSMLLYALQYLTGNRHITLDQIQSFRELGSHCAGHPERDVAAGIEVTTGPLGQGIGNALGMAVAEAFLNARWGDGLVNHRTYAFVGDGCLQEGMGQEMIQLAGHLRLHKLTLLWDDNAITDDGATQLSISEDVAERFRIAGWHVLSVDGHDLSAVSNALGAAQAQTDRPTLIACRTVIAKGLARLEGQRGGHSARLFPDDAAAMRERLGWSGREFEVPTPVLGAWRQAGGRGAAVHAAWRQRVAALPGPRRARFESEMRGDLPGEALEAISQFMRSAAASALTQGGINSSADINDVLTDGLPQRMVVCADLEAPTQHKRRLQAFTATQRAGAYVHAGVREHVMGAMANGMAAHGGVVPLAVTYLAFSDYERGAMRMAALMGLPVHYVFSHDSIGIGKNGPTHQPVEILAGLRAMPNMLVLRPADAVEAAECWAIALQHRQGPTCLVFSRQALMPVRDVASLGSLLDSSPAHGSRRGAYVLREAEGGARRVTLLATGSEVSIAVEARERMQAQGIPTAVVSMPCWALFEQQETAYQIAVLGARGGVRVGVEAAVRTGWDRYLGTRGSFVGMTGFGLSGPAESLYAHFGITAAKVVEQALALLHNDALSTQAF